MPLVRIIALAVLMLLPVMPASAQQWQLATVDDRVNGGSVLTLQGSLGNGALFWAKCDGARTSTLAIISADSRTFPARQNDTRITLEIDVDGYLTSGQALFYTGVGGYIGLELIDRAAVQKALADLGRATFGLKVTVDNQSARINRSFQTSSIRGANAAAREFSAYCFRGGDAPAQTAATTDAPQPADRPSVWSVYSGQGGTRILAGATSPPEGSLYFICDPAGNLYLTYLSDSPQNLTFTRVELNIDLALDIEGETFTARAQYHEDSKGAGIAYSDRDRIFEMLALLAIAKTDVKMTLRGAAAPYERVFPGAGAAKAASDFLAGC